MDMFKDKITIITGAASGIGYALGEVMAKRGAVVVLADIREKATEELAQSLIKDGFRAESEQLDVTDAEAVAMLVKKTIEKHGRLDYMFNNAGIVTFGETRDISLNDWHKVLNINLYGVINGIHAAYPVMVDQGFGHIINTGSIEGLLSYPNAIAYVASKFAVVGLSNTLRIEGADLGVNVSVVCPGLVKTAIFKDSKMVNIDRAKVDQHLAQSKGLTPEECAHIILKGVEQNKAVITTTTKVQILWWMQRLFPRRVMKLMTKRIRGYRKEMRTIA